jgi:hypothetical protein
MSYFTLLLSKYILGYVEMYSLDFAFMLYFGGCEDAGDGDQQQDHDFDNSQDLEPWGLRERLYVVYVLSIITNHLY